MTWQRLAVFVFFAFNGATFGTWTARAPALTAQAGASHGEFGLALLCGSVGMLVMASLSGRLVERVGARAVLAASAAAVCLVLPLLGAADSVPWLALALIVLGASTGVLDVAMNIAGVAVERGLGRPTMPLFHAGFSIGALAGAGAAALAASAGWAPSRHLAVAAIAGALLVAAVLRWAPRNSPRRAPEAAAAPARKPRLGRRPALWLLAAIPLCSAIAEGASSDWSALLLVNEQGTSEPAAALAYAGFSMAMAIARLAGSWIQARFGATRMLVVGASCATTGLLAAAVAGTPAVSYAGFALAGAGLSACFPVALGMAGEAGRRADGTGGEREVAFVTAIAYAGFLGGPPMIGGIAQLTSLSASFIVVALVAAMIAPAAIAVSRALARERAGMSVRA